MEEITIKQTLQLVLLPSPGMGHLIPMIEFAKWLVFHHQDLLVTFLIPTDGSSIKAQETVLNSLPNSINYIYLPPVNFDDLPDDVQIETRIFLTINRSLSSITDALKDLMANSHIVALVLDCFGMDAYDVANQLNLPYYVFFTSAAMGLLFTFELPNLDATYSCEYRDMPEPLKLPGCVPLHGVDFVDPCQDRKGEAYAWMLDQSKRYKFAEGIFVNSFLDLEPGAFKALQEERPSVYPVGPLIRTGETQGVADGSECLKWLSDQPRGSVLFVSFGSGGTLSSEQLTELAFGLEMSGHRFLWVVKSPSDTAVNASYFNAQSVKDPLNFLPKGFIERTKGRGLMVPSWAPQIQVLSHGSTGGFLTHCGWNSTLESIVHGVPLIAWPLYAEQKMNAVMLHGMKAALRPRYDENGLILRDEIAQVVKVLMEGEEGKTIRNKMEQLKHAAAEVLSENGSSTKSLGEVALKWKNHN
ncbi:Glycosyltransferase [Thalictrum thalictroides]|uniref:Glycosyltransferase n=1 Tax=Thalictrum thalictroides TaxID=46969 RepID=A0A7J6UWU4_THATH|nr:Glycosyltransferase [Thalictrum thalictroides]